MSSVSESWTALRQRVNGRWRRYAIEHFARRPWPLNTGTPYVSFTFDDFPITALTVGGRILRQHGVRGTYFVSCNLLDAMSPSGQVASPQDLRVAVDAGHELGCHTFEHLDGTLSAPAEFDRSIAANRRALTGHGFAVDLDVFAYPLNGPDLAVKRVVGPKFDACRWGGQTYNHGVADLSLLKAYFLDRRSRGHGVDVKRLIAENAEQRGWLIFATHDVTDSPSDYGCLPDDFDAVVKSATASGARVLPMGQVCSELGVHRA